jgi:hypothetical protein
LEKPPLLEGPRGAGKAPIREGAIEGACDLAHPEQCSKKSGTIT